MAVLYLQRLMWRFPFWLLAYRACISLAKGLQGTDIGLLVPFLGLLVPFHGLEDRWRNFGEKHSHNVQKNGPFFGTPRNGTSLIP